MVFFIGFSISTFSTFYSPFSEDVFLLKIFIILWIYLFNPFLLFSIPIIVFVLQFFQFFAVPLLTFIFIVWSFYFLTFIFIFESFEPPSELHIIFDVFLIVLVFPFKFVSLFRVFFAILATESQFLFSFPIQNAFKLILFFSLIFSFIFILFFLTQLHLQSPLEISLI